MNRFPYWAFFCNNTFAKDDELRFFEDGSFAITTRQRVVSLYSDKAEFVKRFENAFALENGCICEHKDCELIVHWGNEHLSLDMPSSTFLTVKHNAFADSKKLYLITTRPLNVRVIDLTSDLHVRATSVDGKVVLQDIPKLQTTLMGTDGNVISFPQHVARIDLFPNGAYIVQFLFDNAYKRSCLYNKNNELVLSSEKQYGILTCGAAVCYENALLADLDGNFIGTYGMQNSVFGNISIFPYCISNSNRKDEVRFWPGGDMRCFNIKDYSVLCYWHDGHFYVAPQDPTLRTADIDFKTVHNPQLALYLKRIQEIQF